MHVPVHSAQEGGATDGRPDQRCSSPDEVPEGLPAGKLQPANILIASPALMRFPKKRLEISFVHIVLISISK